MWDAQIAEFSQDHQVIAPDLRGFGASGLGTQPVSMAQFADDLAVMLDELKITEPVIFCGLSMGGYVAWQFWDRHRDRVNKLILCDTRAAADSAEAAQGRRETADKIRTDGTAALVEGMLPKLFAKSSFDNAAAQVEGTRRVMESTDPNTVIAALLAMADRPNMEPRLAEISVPSLVVCGEVDAITPADEMRRVAAAMPNARFEEISDAGHMSPLEQSSRVNQEIRKFLQQG